MAQVSHTALMESLFSGPEEPRTGVRVSRFLTLLQGEIERLQEGDPDPEREEMLEWVKEIAETSEHTYGSRRRQPRRCGHWDIG